MGLVCHEVGLLTCDPTPNEGVLQLQVCAQICRDVGRIVLDLKLLILQDDNAFVHSLTQKLLLSTHALDQG